MSKKRSIKVYGQSGYKYRETPTIMLKGMWLKEAGFDVGDYISVICEDGKIVIAQDVERAAVKAQRPSSWTGRCKRSQVKKGSTQPMLVMCSLLFVRG